MKTFEKVIPLLKKRWPRYLAGIFVLMMVDGIQLFVPKVIQTTIDNISKGTFTTSQLAQVGLLLVAMAAGILIFRFLWRIFIIGNAWFFEKELRKQYYNHLLLLSKNYFNKAKIGDLMARATNDLNSIRMLFGIGFVAIFEMIVFLVASLIFMLNISVKLTAICVIPMPVMTVVIIFTGKYMHKRFAKVQAAFSSMSGAAQETISGIRVVKAFNQEENEVDKLKVFGKEYVNQNMKLAIINGAFHPFMGFIISVSTSLALIYGGIFTIESHITTGQYISFFSYLGMLAWPIMAIGFSINLYQTGTASLKRINKIFEVKPEIVDENPDKSLTNINGDIEIKNLSFKYDKNLPLVFDNINLKVEKGHTLAILGRTGSGKSTFLDLITRVYNPPKNSIYFDGNDIYQYPLEVLHNSLVMVPQDIFLFSDTILENVRLGKPEASLEEVIDVCKKAHVYNDIIGFTNGFDTIVGERGVTLSGGQKQRIAIARALLCNPDVLILDDSLSAVDTKTEKSILEHLIEMRKNKTTIIVAHRVSSIEHAERIVFLDKGKIVESGSHNQLLQHNGLYKELFDRQQLEQKIEDE